MKRCCQCHGSGIRTASSQGGIIIILIHSLESGNDDNPAGIQLTADTLCVNSFQSCILMAACGMHGHLKSIQGNRRNAQLVHYHGHQRYGHLLTDGKEHIHLTLRRLVVHIMSHTDQLICIFSHGGQNHHHVISFFIFLDTTVGNIIHSLFVPNGSTAEFLNYQHSFSFHAVSFIFYLRIQTVSRSCPLPE